MRCLDILRDCGSITVMQRQVCDKILPCLAENHCGISQPVHVSMAPLLQVRLRAAVEDFISEGAAPAERMIRDLVDCEHAYINTDHPQFIGGNRALSQVHTQQPHHDSLHGLMSTKKLIHTGCCFMH